MNKGIVSLEMRNLTPLQNYITVITITIVENYLKVFSNALESITLTNIRKKYFWVPQDDRILDSR